MLSKTEQTKQCEDEQKMLLRINKKNGKECDRAQAVLEYALVVAIVSAAFLTMGLYVRKAVQGGLYQIEGRIDGRSNVSKAAPLDGGGGGWGWGWN